MPDDKCYPIYEGNNKPEKVMRASITFSELKFSSEDRGEYPKTRKKNETRKEVDKGKQ